MTEGFTEKIIYEIDETIADTLQFWINIFKKDKELDVDLVNNFINNIPLKILNRKLVKVSSIDELKLLIFYLDTKDKLFLQLN